MELWVQVIKPALAMDATGTVECIAPALGELVQPGYGGKQPVLTPRFSFSLSYGYNFTEEHSCAGSGIILL